MRDFDPHRIAAQWNGGRGTAMYAYAMTDRVPTDDFKDRLVSEIERTMARADDDGLDELEILLMHIEDQHPDMYPDSNMHEAWGTVDKGGNEVWHGDADDDRDIRDLYTAGGEALDDSPHGKLSCKVCGRPGGCRCASEEIRREGDGASQCVECGGVKNEGTCECAMHESTLRALVSGIIKEMKLGIAGRGNFDFSQRADDEEDVASFLLNKKKKEEAPPPKKSGTKLSIKKRRSKSSQYR